MIGGDNSAADELATTIYEKFSEYLGHDAAWQSAYRAMLMQYFRHVETFAPDVLPEVARDPEAYESFLSNDAMVLTGTHACVALAIGAACRKVAEWQLMHHELEDAALPSALMKAMQSLYPESPLSTRGR